jgi:hypothetical protein
MDVTGGGLTDGPRPPILTTAVSLMNFSISSKSKLNYSTMALIGEIEREIEYSSQRLFMITPIDEL